MLRRPPSSPRVPSTTLFRTRVRPAGHAAVGITARHRHRLNRRRRADLQRRAGGVLRRCRGRRGAVREVTSLTAPPPFTPSHLPIPTPPPHPSTKHRSPLPRL